MPHSKLFSPLRLRDIEFRNRVFVSPMCQYSCDGDGIPTPWHMVHLGSRASGGASLVIAEATGVTAEGRISPGDTGIWSDAHTQAWAPIAAFIKSQGAVAGIQLAHAGRKASTHVPWRKDGAPLTPDEGGWPTLAPSAVAFASGHPVPREATAAELDEAAEAFVAGARRALDAGFQLVEIHAAHGYLLHEFLSPLSNRRTDENGGDLEGRMRFPLRVARAMREAWPENLPVFVRISATDWGEGGWDLPQSVEFCRRLKELGIDLIDCSSGALVPNVKIPAGPGYQVPFAAAIREQAGIPTGAVGMIVDPHQAEQIVSLGQADAVLLAREMLRDPYWALHAAHALGVGEFASWPIQYERAKPQ